MVEFFYTYEYDMKKNLNPQQYHRAHQEQTQTFYGMGAPQNTSWNDGIVVWCAFCARQADSRGREDGCGGFGHAVSRAVKKRAYCSQQPGEDTLRG